MMPRRILVIDDPTMLDLYHDLLTDEGYDVIDAARLLTPAEVEQIAPDLIIVDAFIRGQPVGGELIAALKAQPATAPIPVLLCTAASAAVERVLPYLLATNVPVLHKPFDIDELLHTVALLLGDSRLAPMHSQTLPTASQTLVCAAS
jgi:two-component system, chemotaxis family, response regulator PixH